MKTSNGKIVKACLVDQSAKKSKKKKSKKKTEVFVEDDLAKTVKKKSRKKSNNSEDEDLQSKTVFSETIIAENFDENPASTKTKESPENDLQSDHTEHKIHKKKKGKNKVKDTKYSNFNEHIVKQQTEEAKENVEIDKEVAMNVKCVKNKSKASKKRKEITDNLEETNNNSSKIVSDDLVQKSKKKKRKIPKNEKNDNVAKKSTLLGKMSDDRVVDQSKELLHSKLKLKKRKKIKKVTVDSIEEDITRNKMVKQEKKPKNDTEICSDNTSHISVDKKPITKKKKLKELDEVDTIEDNLKNENSEQKKKAKKHKISQVDHEEVDQLVIAKKKKTKKQQDTDLKYNKAVSGVLGENVSLDASKKIENNNKEESTQLGQWSNVKFSDTNKQDKFLRLMGGKKSTNPNRGKLWSGTKQNFSTSALSITESSKLNQALEGQFQNALDFQLQKRSEQNMCKGLGFKEDPSYGKKFYIDINKSSSIKFD